MASEREKDRNGGLFSTHFKPISKRAPAGSLIVFVRKSTDNTYNKQSKYAKVTQDTRQWRFRSGKLFYSNCAAGACAKSSRRSRRIYGCRDCCKQTGGRPLPVLQK